MQATQAPECKRDPATFADKLSHATSLGHEDNQKFWDYKTKAYVAEHRACFEATLAKATRSQWGHLKGAPHNVWDEDMIHRHCLGQHNVEKKAWQCFEDAMVQFEKLGVAALTEEDVEVAKTGGIIFVHNKDKHQRPIIFVKLNRFQVGKNGITSREHAASCLIYYVSHLAACCVVQTCRSIPRATTWRYARFPFSIHHGSAPPLSSVSRSASLVSHSLTRPWGLRRRKTR
mgnify:CR=1 FL=1